VVLHRDAPASVIKVAVIVGYHINRKTGVAFPGMRTIAKLTSLSTSTINKAVKWLQTFGYLEIQPGKTRNATNRYLPILNQGANRVFAPGCYRPSYLPS
jgi:DNA-binding transcriptional regulator YhcF (GntR family)